MRRILRVRNVILVLILMLVGYFINFAYQTNNVCEPGEHIMQSEADAIETAKQIVSKESVFDSGQFNNGADAVETMNQMSDCCYVNRTRNIYGVIVWDVSMIAEKGHERFSVEMELSNCGSLFHDTEFSSVEPIR